MLFNRILCIQWWYVWFFVLASKYNRSNICEYLWTFQILIERRKMLLKCCLCRTLFCHDVEYVHTNVHNSIWEGKPADSGPYTGALVAGLRHVGPTCLLEEDLGSDGKAGRASNSRSCVILTTQTGCLMTGSNNNHMQTDRHTKLCCVIISPKQEKTKLITAISERGEREKEERRSGRTVKRRGAGDYDPQHFTLNSEGFF